MIYPTEVQNTSAPVVTHGVVIVGSSIGDNSRVDEPRGTVRALDCGHRQTALGVRSHSAQSFRTQCRKLDGQRCEHHRRRQCLGADLGGRSARARLFADDKSQPRFLGRHAPATIATPAPLSPSMTHTGKVVWSFQTAHHNVWDYYLPAEPTLGTVTYEDKTSPALLQATKQGLLFTLDRETGKPIIAVEERRVPQGGAPGEQLSPTQPFPLRRNRSRHPHQTRRRLRTDLLGSRRLPRQDRRRAQRRHVHTAVDQGHDPLSLHRRRHELGRARLRRKHDIVYVNTSSAMHLVTLIPRGDFAA